MCRTSHEGLLKETTASALGNANQGPPQRTRATAPEELWAPIEPAASCTSLLSLPGHLNNTILAWAGLGGAATAAISCSALNLAFRGALESVELASRFLLERHGLQTAARHIYAFVEHVHRPARLPPSASTFPAQRQNPHFPPPSGRRQGAVVAELLEAVVSAGAEVQLHDALLLSQSAKAGHVEVVEALVGPPHQKHGSSVRTGPYAHVWGSLRHGPSAFALSRALTTAAQHGQAGVLTALLRAGAPVGAYQGAALLAASGHGDPEVVHRLCAAGADPTTDGSAALRRAVQGGHVEAARVLLLHGADPRARCSAVLLHACELQVASASASATASAGYTSTASYYSFDSISNSASASASFPPSEGTSATASRSASVPASAAAAQVGTARLEADVLALLELLLAAGADARQHGRAGLEAAAARGYESLVRVLLRAGADPMAHQSAALVAASIQGHDGVVGLLLESGADPWDMSGLALRTAGERGHAPVVERLRVAASQRADNSSGGFAQVGHNTTVNGTGSGGVHANFCSGSRSSGSNATAAAVLAAMGSTGGKCSRAGGSPAGPIWFFSALMDLRTGSSSPRPAGVGLRLGQGLVLDDALEESFRSLS